MPRSESYPGNPVNPPKAPAGRSSMGPSLANLMQGDGSIPFRKCVGCGRAISSSEGTLCAECERVQHYYSDTEAFDNYEDQQPTANSKRSAY